MSKRNTPGCRVIRAALDAGDWSLLTKAGFQASDFSEDAKIVHRWVESYTSKHNSLPSTDLITETIGVDFPAACAFEFAAEQFKDYLLRKEVIERLDRIRSELNQGNTAAAAALFTPVEYTPKEIKSFAESRQGIYDEYCTHKLQGVEGIDIPWPTLEQAFMKWENSTFNAFLAMSNKGKTWISCYIANYAMSLGNKVLFVSMENTVDSIQRRLAALHYKLPFGDLRSGQLDMRLDQKWQSMINNKLTGDILFADYRSVKTPEDVSAINFSEKPDLIIIDGAYYLRGRGKDNWERAADVLANLHVLSKHGKAPWLCSSQLNPPKKKSAGGYEQAYEARYAKEWMTNPATVFILDQDEDDLSFNRAIIKIAKIREAGDMTAVKREFPIHSNRVTMDYSEILEEEDYGIEY